MRLLLVEDEPDVAETLSGGLATEGYVVGTADNGVDGLWKAARVLRAGTPLADAAMDGNDEATTRS